MSELENDKRVLEERVQEVAGLAKGATTFQFKNAIEQVRVLNANLNVQVDDRVLKSEHRVEGDEIVLP